MRENEWLFTLWLNTSVHRCVLNISLAYVDDETWRNVGCLWQILYAKDVRLNTCFFIKIFINVYLLRVTVWCVDKQHCVRYSNGCTYK